MKVSLRSYLGAALAAACLFGAPIAANAEAYEFLNPGTGAYNVRDNGSGTNYVNFNANNGYAPFTGNSRMTSSVNGSSGTYEGGIGLYCPAGTQSRYVGGAQGQFRSGTAAGSLSTTCPSTVYNDSQATGFAYFDSYPNN